MSVYNYITLGAAKQQLANRLYDSNMTFWAPAELTLYIQESLRTWNALTAYWRGDFLFQSQQGVNWYNLIDTINLPNTLRPLTVLDTDIYKLLQYHLLEPTTWNPYVGGSLQFSADDFLEAVQRRRDEILSVCACTMTLRTVPAVAGRIQLPDTVIDVRRMAYLPNPVFGQPNSAMWPEDAWAEQSFNRNYTLAPAGTPFTYLMSTQPPISFDTDVPPAYGGNYELLTIETGLALAVNASSFLSVPDDWTPLIKWGALADLLSRESNAKDLPRAAYCEQQYRMGLAALSAAPALLALRINNVPVLIDSVRNADLYTTGWETTTQGKPTAALHAGLNMIALAPAPDAGPYSLTATVVENAPVPVADGDFVQVARDDLDAILDYAQHLAAFKQGGEEFTRSMQLLQRFMKQAAMYNGKLLEIAEFNSMLLGISQMERGTNPTMTPSAEQEVTS